MVTEILEPPVPTAHRDTSRRHCYRPALIRSFALVKGRYRVAAAAPPVQPERLAVRRRTSEHLHATDDMSPQLPRLALSGYLIFGGFDTNPAEQTMPKRLGSRTRGGFRLDLRTLADCAGPRTGRSIAGVDHFTDRKEDSATRPSKKVARHSMGWRSRRIDLNVLAPRSLWELRGRGAWVSNPTARALALRVGAQGSATAEPMTFGGSGRSHWGVDPAIDCAHGGDAADRLSELDSGALTLPGPLPHVNVTGHFLAAARSAMVCSLANRLPPLDSHAC